MKAEENETVSVPVEDYFSETGKKYMIDVRRAEDYEYDTFRGAWHIPLEELAERQQELPRDGKVFLLCYNGRRSDAEALRLRTEGIDAYSIAQGYYALVKWRLQQAAEQSGTDGAAPDSPAAAEPGDAPKAARAGRKESAAHIRCKEIERSIIKTYRKEIWRRFTRAVNTYELIRDGDHIAVCISGGKDSMLMAKLFQELLRHGKKNFSCTFLVMNPGYNALNYEVIRSNAKLLEIPVSVFDSEIYDIVAQERKGSPCYLCARMRRGNLYAHAQALGCNKIALGHHYDDVIETILMGMLYGGQIQTMMPKLKSTNFPGMELIRPMYLIREDDIKRWRDLNDLHFIRCACRLTEQCDLEGMPEGRQEGAGPSDGEAPDTDTAGILAGKPVMAGVLPAAVGHKRTEVKQLIRELAKRSPYIEQNIFKSVENVHIDAVIEYRRSDGTRKHFLDDYEIPECAERREAEY